MGLKSYREDNDYATPVSILLNHCQSHSAKTLLCDYIQSIITQKDTRAGVFLCVLRFQVQVISV